MNLKIIKPVYTSASPVNFQPTPIQNKLFALVLIILFSIYACSGNDDDPATNNGPNNQTLDLREANVTALVYDSATSRFDVTLFHDDDGESGYADQWQVEKLDGTFLGEHILGHAHGTVEFTRSEIVSVPVSEQYVVVRGHDQTHGYGGQAIIYEIARGVEDKIAQGSEPIDFTNYPNFAP